MKHLFEYLKTKALDTNPKDVADNEQDRFKEPPMTGWRADVTASLNYRETSEKMKAWHEGKRRENIKVCKDAKLICYYVFCKQHGYEDCCEKCEEEANRRGWTFKKLKER